MEESPWFPQDDLETGSAGSHAWGIHYTSEKQLDFGKLMVFLFWWGRLKPPPELRICSFSCSLRRSLCVNDGLQGAEGKIPQIAPCFHVAGVLQSTEAFFMLKHYFYMFLVNTFFGGDQIKWILTSDPSGLFPCHDFLHSLVLASVLHCDTSNVVIVLDVIQTEVLNIQDSVAWKIKLTSVEPGFQCKIFFVFQRGT